MTATARLSRIRDLRALVDARLRELVPDPGDAPHRLHAAMNYAALAPGKRIRPLLALLTAERLGVDVETALDPACAVEMVHAASLVLDDLPCMDDAPMRRGQPSTHVRYGEGVAVLTGVALLNQAFLVVSEAQGVDEGRRLDMVRALSRAVGLDGLVDGQDRDLRGAGASLTGVTELNHRKTGVLFVASVEIGALASGARAPALEALRVFGTELGLAFQALDDIADSAGGEDAARTTVFSVLGGEGARAEADRRLGAAADALKAAGPSLEALKDDVRLLLGTP